MRFHIGYSFKLKDLKWLLLALFGFLGFSGIFDLSKKDLTLIPKVYADTNLDTYYNISLNELSTENGQISSDVSLQDILNKYYDLAVANHNLAIYFRYINEQNFSVKIIYANESNFSGVYVRPYVLKSSLKEFRMLASKSINSNSIIEIILSNNSLSLLKDNTNAYTDLTTLLNDFDNCYNNGVCDYNNNLSTSLSIYHYSEENFSNSSSYTFSLNSFDYYYYYYPTTLTYQQMSNSNNYLLKEFRIDLIPLTSLSSPIITYCDKFDCTSKQSGGGDSPGGETTIEDLENTILDNTIPDIPSFNDIEITTDSAISGLLLLPITLLQRLNNSIGGTCTPYTIPFGLTGGNETLTFPCIVLEDYLGSNLVQIIDLAICLFLVYEVAMLIISSFESITSLEDGFASLYTPRHARPMGKHTKEVD